MVRKISFFCFFLSFSILDAQAPSKVIRGQKFFQKKQKTIKYHQSKNTYKTLKKFSSKIQKGKKIKKKMPLGHQYQQADNDYQQEKTSQSQGKSIFPTPLQVPSFTHPQIPQLAQHQESISMIPLKSTPKGKRKTKNYLKARGNKKSSTSSVTKVLQESLHPLKSIQEEKTNNTSFSLGGLNTSPTLSYEQDISSNNIFSNNTATTSVFLTQDQHKLPSHIEENHIDQNISEGDPQGEKVDNLNYVKKFLPRSKVSIKTSKLWKNKNHRKKKIPTKKKNYSSQYSKKKMGRFLKNDGADQGTEQTNDLAGAESTPLIFFNLYDLNMVTGAAGLEAMKNVINIISSNPGDFLREEPKKPTKMDNESDEDYKKRLDAYKIVLDDYITQIFYYCQNIYICYSLSTGRIREYSFILRSLIFSLMEVLFPAKTWLVPPPEYLVDQILQLCFFSELNDLSRLKAGFSYLNSKYLWKGLLQYHHMYSIAAVAYRFLFATVSNHYLYTFSNPFRNTAADLRISGIPLGKIISKDTKGQPLCYPVVPFIFQKQNGQGFDIVSERTPLPVDDLAP